MSVRVHASKLAKLGQVSTCLLVLLLPLLLGTTTVYCVQ